MIFNNTFPQMVVVVIDYCCCDSKLKVKNNYGDLTHSLVIEEFFFRKLLLDDFNFI